MTLPHGRPVRHYWLSTEAMTVVVGVRYGVVRETPPILTRFRGQRWPRLLHWLRGQPGFRMHEYPW